MLRGIHAEESVSLSPTGEDGFLAALEMTRRGSYAPILSFRGIHAEESVSLSPTGEDGFLAALEMTRRGSYASETPPRPDQPNNPVKIHLCIGETHNEKT